MIEDRIKHAQSIGGEAYSESGRRNPIRRDTNEVLASLVLAKRPRLIVEVGTGYGTSTLCMALSLPEGGRIVTFELSNPVAEEVQAMFDAENVPAHVVAGKIEDVFDPAVLDGQQIDLLFLDGEKSAYAAHLALLEPHLAPGALILADNTIDRQTEAQPYLDYVGKHYQTFTIPTECGLTVSSR